jgi:hypothetical protein
MLDPDSSLLAGVLLRALISPLSGACVCVNRLFRLCLVRSITTTYIPRVSLPLVEHTHTHI